MILLENDSEWVIRWLAFCGVITALHAGCFGGVTVELEKETASKSELESFKILPDNICALLSNQKPLLYHLHSSLFL